MGFDSIVNLPQMIKQKFSNDLLSTPSAKFRDSLDTFDRMYKKCLKNWRKLDKCPSKKQKCEFLKMEIDSLYEQAKEKEKEREAEKDHKTQGFMYSVNRPTRLVKDVYARLVFGSKTGDFSFFFGENNALHPTRKKRRKIARNLGQKRPDRDCRPPQDQAKGKTLTPGESASLPRL